MQDNQEIKQYYDELATRYDQDRFANSYGQFIDRQERLILEKELNGVGEPILDLACGTGRLLGFASQGVEISPEMLAVAKQKYPEKNLTVASAKETGLTSQSFGFVFSFHLIMHLRQEDLVDILQEVHRLLRSGGIFLFDFPSAKRRALLSKNQKGWHGANEMNREEIASLLGTEWKLLRSYGVLFFPIHRLPVFMRPLFFSLDNWLCRSIFKSYASYQVVVLQKK